MLKIYSAEKTANLLQLYHNNNENNDEDITLTDISFDEGCNRETNSNCASLLTSANTNASNKLHASIDLKDSNEGSFRSFSLEDYNSDSFSGSKQLENGNFNDLDFIANLEDYELLNRKENIFDCLDV